MFGSATRYTPEMSNQLGWKIATVAFAGTSIALGALLAVGPGPPEHAQPGRPHADRSAPKETGVPETTRRQRVRTQRETEATTTEHAQQPPVADATARAALAALPIREALYRHAFVNARGSIEGANFDLLMERLRRDEDAAIAILDDWIARYRELAPMHGGMRVWVFDAYVELRGEAALPLLGELRQIHGVVPAMIRAGATDELERIDRAYRIPDAKDLPFPMRFARSGPRALEYIRRWARDHELSTHLRRDARISLWMYGAAADRTALWESASPLERMSDYRYMNPAWPVDRNAQARDATARYLEDADPWVRMHAARRCIQRTDAWGAALRDRAIQHARVDAELPNPGGHEPTEWKKLQTLLRTRVQLVDQEAERRRLAGLE